jgi:hypothetical protein
MVPETPTTAPGQFTSRSSSTEPVCSPQARARTQGSARSEAPSRALSVVVADPTAAPWSTPRWVTNPDGALGPDPDAPRACLYSHKSAGGILRWSGEVISLAGEVGSGSEQAARSVKRGTITEWSERSRRRLVKMVLASEAAKWGQRGDMTAVLLVTLTYPGQDGREYIPHDGRVARAQRARFLQRWNRRFDGCRGVWKLEFQARAGEWAHDWERCAPHWTMWLEAPERVALPEIREWVSSTWWQLVGSQAQSHLLAGTRVEPWHGSLVGYALKYMRKGHDKEYQHRVPEGYVNPGRWWGLVRLPVRWTEIPLSERQFFTLRRLLIKSRQRVRRRRSRLKVLSRYGGLWMWTRRDGVARTADMVRAFMRGTQLAIDGVRGVTPR